MPKGGGRRVGRKIIAGIVIFGLTIIGGLWLVVLEYLHQDRIASQHAHEVELGALARAVEEHTHRTIIHIDGMVKHLRQEYTSNPKAFNESVRHFMGMAPISMQQIGVIDRNGLLTHSSIPINGPVDLSDRQHYRAHLDNPDDFLFISQPIYGRVSHRWSLQFTRKILGHNGDFIGVMVVSVDPEEFTRYFDALDIPTGSAIALVGRDRVVRARVSNPPTAENPVGKTVPAQLDYFRENGPLTGMSLLQGVFDGGVPRLILYRQVGPHPLIVSVSHSAEHIFSDHQKRRLMTYWLTAAISLGVILSCSLLIWLVLRQIRTQAEIEASRQILKQQADDLARSNAELESFAYVSSHDLREPLRMVTSYLRLIERRLGETLDSDIKDFIGFAVEGAERMDRLILDLLEYSRVGRSRTAMEPVKLDDVVNSSLILFQEKLAELGGSIQAQSGLPTVSGQRDELLRLMQNLIGNAIKYRSPDRPPHIALTWSTTGSEVVLSLQDNGIGIEQQYFDRIFVIFQRLHGRGSYEGTGIGLALCKKIVSQHHGRIWVDSTPGQGSTFHIALPL